jgi:predicted transposase YbfD/YdcC
MAKGFAPVLKSEREERRKKPIPLTSINKIQANLLDYVSDIPDPRVPRTKKHLLKDILVIAILAVIGGAEGWEDMENYGLSKLEWLKDFLELPHGIPSDDTFRRLFERLNPKVLETMSHFKRIEFSYDQRIEKGHHRLEKRQVWAVPLAAFGGLYQQEQWSGLQSIIIVERVRHLWNKTTHEVQFYLSSLPADAQLIGRAIRQHWGIENQVHWTLDVTFNEDQCRIRSGNSPTNFALLRRIALNALNKESTCQRSLRQKSKRAAMNNDYMMTVLYSFCQA